MNGPTQKVQMKGTPECDILVSRLGFETFWYWSLESLVSEKKSRWSNCLLSTMERDERSQFSSCYWTSRASLTVRIRYELEKRLRSVYIEPKSDHCLASGTNMANLVKAVKGRHQKILVTSHGHECTRVNSTSLECLFTLIQPRDWLHPMYCWCSLYGAVD